MSFRSIRPAAATPTLLPAMYQSPFREQFEQRHQIVYSRQRISPQVSEERQVRRGRKAYCGPVPPAFYLPLLLFCLRFPESGLRTGASPSASRWPRRPPAAQIVSSFLPWLKKLQFMVDQTLYNRRNGIFSKRVNVAHIMLKGK